MNPIAEGGGGYIQDEVTPEFDTVTVAEINAQVQQQVPGRPRRAAAAGVSAAVRALETPHRRRQREAAEQVAAAQIATAEAQINTDPEAARLAALESAVQSQSKRPPLTKQEWEAHIYTSLCPAFEHLFERFNEGGDRYKSIEFFRGARIFNPTHARTLTRQQAFELIDKLKHYPIFNEGGDISIITKIKKGWSAYHQNAQHVFANFGKHQNGDKDTSSIATWHYRMYLRIDSEKCDDQICRYCPKKTKSCHCYDHLKVWWEACELATLVLPTSGTAERVFSLSNMLFSDQQSNLLSDAIRLSLYLAFNKRGD